MGKRREMMFINMMTAAAETLYSGDPSAVRCVLVSGLFVHLLDFRIMTGNTLKGSVRICS